MLERHSSRMQKRKIWEEKHEGVVLFGGHGGTGYQRRPCGDTHVLNLDNDRWQELACQGNPPSARCGHTSFAKDGCPGLWIQAYV